MLVFLLQHSSLHFLFDRLVLVFDWASRAAFSLPSLAKYANNASTETSTTPANGEISADADTASSAIAGIAVAAMNTTTDDASFSRVDNSATVRDASAGTLTARVVVAERPERPARDRVLGVVGVVVPARVAKIVVGVIRPPVRLVSSRLVSL